MTSIESKTVQINKSIDEIYEFLINLNNHKILMPENVSDWWSNMDEAKLKIQGLGTLHLKKAESKLNSYLKIVPASKAPVDLFIEWFLSEENKLSNIKVVINAELNMIMKMIAEKPLQNLANFMSESLKNHFN
ncbi:MAG: SRPBCC family protein [Bacteroidia bacterium]|nr:SRPBCC family protein [Bacteroidia bacterium]